MLPDLYAIDDSGRVSRLERYVSGAGEEDLRPLVERNPGLLPGSHNGESSGWLLVGRNLHPDPTANGDGWDLDYLYVDREGVPTLVDCKIPFESRSRHELMGRMFEYAASAQTSWGSTDLWTWLRREHDDPEVAVDSFLGSSESAAEGFLDSVLERLKSGRFRLVFLVGDANPELLRVTEFLNQQLATTQFFVMEARQYRTDGVRILVPALFGPEVGPPPEEGVEEPPVEEGVEVQMFGGDPELEQLNESGMEEEFETEASGVAAVVDEGSYFGEIENRLAGDQVRAVRTLYEVAQKLAFGLHWANSDGGPSLEISRSDIAERPLLSLGADGAMTLNFGSLTGHHQAESHQQRFRSIAHNRLDLVFHLDEMHPTLRPGEWCPKLAGVLRTLDDLSTIGGQPTPPASI